MYMRPLSMPAYRNMLVFFIMMKKATRHSAANTQATKTNDPKPASDDRGGTSLSCLHSDKSNVYKPVGDDKGDASLSCQRQGKLNVCNPIKNDKGDTPLSCSHLHMLNVRRPVPVSDDKGGTSL